MLATLGEVCQFDVVNAGQTQLSLSATNAVTGESEFFQRFDVGPQKKRKIIAEHVLGSG